MPACRVHEAYVPPGAASPKASNWPPPAATARPWPCAICHGEGLKGLGEVPSLAGRDPMYLTRQLMDIK